MKHEAIKKIKKNYLKYPQLSHYLVVNSDDYLKHGIKQCFFKAFHQAKKARLKKLKALKEEMRRANRKMKKNLCE